MGHAKHQDTTILLIEDEALIRMATAAMLEDSGYQVLEAVNGDAGLAILQTHDEIDLVITDVQMPGKIDGLALVEIISRDYPGIHALITSGRASLSEARQSGAKKFLTKPYTAAAIQSAIDAVLGVHPAGYAAR